MTRIYSNKSFATNTFEMEDLNHQKGKMVVQHTRNETTEYSQLWFLSETGTIYLIEEKSESLFKTKGGD